MPSDISEDDGFENPLWVFSLRVYGRDSVKAACLALQDHAGADVNILLFLCWLAHCGAAQPSGQDFDRIIQATANLRAQVVEPLRRVRRALPDAAADMDPDRARRAVLAAELEGERLIQTILFQKFANRPKGTGDPGQAIRSYLDRIPGNTINSEIIDLIDRLTSAVQAS
ncbi:MAG: TIGR02444 family protein [Sphingomonadales bacterium]